MSLDDHVRNYLKRQYTRELPNYAEVVRVRDRGLADIRLPGSDQVIYGVKVLGTVKNINEGNVMPITWVEEKGSNRPVVLSDIGDDYYDDNIFYLNETGNISIRQGAIKPEHLSFQPYTNPGDLPTNHIVISTYEPQNPVPGLFWLNPIE